MQNSKNYFIFSISYYYFFILINDSPGKTRIKLINEKVKKFPMHLKSKSEEYPPR